MHGGQRLGCKSMHVLAVPRKLVGLRPRLWAWTAFWVVMSRRLRPARWRFAARPTRDGPEKATGRRCTLGTASRLRIMLRGPSGGRGARGEATALRSCMSTSCSDPGLYDGGMLRDAALGCTQDEVGQRMARGKMFEAFVHLRCTLLKVPRLLLFLFLLLSAPLIAHTRHWKERA